MLFLVADVRKTDRTARAFLSSALGFFLCTSAYAVWHTKGYSILTFVFPAIALLVFANRKHASRGYFQHLLQEGRAFADILLISAVLVTVQLFRNDHFNPDMVSLGSLDFGVYATASEYLPVAGIEVSSPWYQLWEVSADGLAKPYHYTDLWGLAAILDFSRLRPSDGYVFVWIPVVNALLCGGLKAILSKVAAGAAVGWFAVVVAFSGLFLCMYIPNVEWSYGLAWNLIVSPKIAALGIGLAVWAVGRLCGIPWLDIFILCVIMFSDILMAPVLLFAFSAFYLVLLIRRLEPHGLKKNLLLGLGAASVFCFYAAAGSLSTSSLSTHPPGPEGYLYWFVKMLFASQIKYYLFFAPLLLTAWMLVRKHIRADNAEKQIFWAFLGLSLSGSVIQAIFNTNVESFQFVWATHTLSAQLALVFSIALGIRELHLRQAVPKGAIYMVLLPAGVQLAFGVFNSSVIVHNRESRYTAGFIKAVETVLDDKNPMGVSVHDPGRYGTLTADPRMCYACNFLKKTGNHYWTNQISIPEDMNHLPYPERKTAIESSPFYRFKEKMRQNDPAYSFEKAQMEFINRYEVDFLVLEKDATPPRWLPHCTEQLIEDPESGTALVLLKRPCHANRIAE